MPFPRLWHAGDPPASWEACLGLGADGHPSAKAREAVAVRLHARKVGSDASLSSPLTQTPPDADDASRIRALLNTELAAATLPGTPWSALLSAGDDFRERVQAVLGSTVEQAAERVRPLLALFDDASVGLTDIGRAGFQSLYMDVAGYADSWVNHVAEESGYVEFVQSAQVDRGFREAWLGVDNLAGHRTLYAHIHRQFCEAVAFFTVCRRNPARLLGLPHSPRQGWIGWLAESAEFARAGFDATSEDYDPANEFHTTLIGDASRARANFGCLALFARTCYEPVPVKAPNYLWEPEAVDRAVGRFLESYPLPRSETVVLVGEIAMLQAMLPDDADLDHVLEMLGFPPGPRLPWRWRVWLDQLSGAVLSRLSAAT